MPLLDRLERRFARYAIPRLTIYIIVGQVMVYIMREIRPPIQEQLMLLPSLVLEGEVWRLLTFPFVPGPQNLLFFIIGIMVFQFLGSTLEMTWGTVRFNLFLLSGYLITVGSSFIYPEAPATNSFIGLSVFLAFATLNPEFTFRLYFILPVKVKWLALLSWVFIFYQLAVAPAPVKVMVLAGISNYLLFFGPTMIGGYRSSHRRAVHQAQMKAHESKAFHECRICGVTDISDPSMDFRYCSKCDGTPCYCENHIKDHEHIVPADEPAP